MLVMESDANGDEPDILKAVGYSLLHTKLKQEQLRVVVTTLAGMLHYIRQRSYGPQWGADIFHWVDLNAGPGWYGPQYPDGPFSGSPLVALEAAAAREFYFRGIACEQDPEVLSTLCTSLQTIGGLWPHGPVNGARVFQSSYGQRFYRVFAQPYTQAWPAILAQLQGWQRPPPETRHVFGAIYSDENGTVPPFPLLAEAAVAFPKMDLIIYVSAANIKRILKAGARGVDGRLDEMMARIRKSYWLIREPKAKHQWTFLIGTNMKQFPEFAKQGIYHLTSPMGLTFANRLFYTAEELRDMNLKEEA
jgi:hypothetical protein